MGVSFDLQRLIVDRIKAEVPALGGRVFDRPPEAVTWPYVSLGPSDYRRDDVECIVARTESQQIDVWSRYAPGKREVKDITDAIVAALHGYESEAGAYTRLSVTLAMVMADPDPAVSHGVVQVEALIED